MLVVKMGRQRHSCTNFRQQCYKRGQLPSPAARFSDRCPISPYRGGWVDPRTSKERRKSPAHTAVRTPDHSPLDASLYWQRYPPSPHTHTHTHTHTHVRAHTHTNFIYILYMCVDRFVGYERSNHNGCPKNKSQIKNGIY